MVAMNEYLEQPELVAELPRGELGALLVKVKALEGAILAQLLAPDGSASPSILSNGVVKSALVYPVAVLSVAAGVIVCLLWKVVPIFATLFLGLESTFRCLRES